MRAEHSEARARCRYTSEQDLFWCLMKWSKVMAFAFASCELSLMILCCLNLFLIGLLGGLIRCVASD